MTDGKTGRYSEAGVSIDRGNELVERIKPLVEKTARAGVLGNIGGFGGLFDIGALGYRHPVLVSGTDGVGTKLKLAIELGRHDGVGIDLVAMCANDLLVQGAEPLFFLDYYACGKLDVEVAAAVVEGIAEGCRLAGCALIGGETAEMPGMYQTGDYDLAGFGVGIVEKENIIDGRGIRAGDAIIGLASSGAHSNGYSLIRKILHDTRTSAGRLPDGSPILDVLMEPTRIYARSVLRALPQVSIKGMSHITGGGLVENLPRILPDEVTAGIDCRSWQWPALFQWLQDAGDISTAEMYRTFNCGIGYVVITSADSADAAVELFNDLGEGARVIGRVETRGDGRPPVLLNGL